MKIVTLRNETTGQTLATDVSVATSLWARFWGLMGRKSLADDAGILIRPCASVHMFFMRFPLDVVFTDRDYTVVKIVSSLKQWRIATGGKGAHSAIELPAGSATRRVSVGDRLALDTR